MSSVATRADLNTRTGSVEPVNPIDIEGSVFVEDTGDSYLFDYTSNAEVDGNTVLDCGTFAEDHPTHAGQPFMTGRWLRV